MIKIEISEEKRKEIEKLHWEWFKNYLDKKDIPFNNGKKKVHAFLQELCKNKEKGLDLVLERIIIGREQIIKDYGNKTSTIYKRYNKCKAKNFPIKIGDRNVENWSLGKILKNYFGFDDFEKGQFPYKNKNGEEVKWDAYELTRRLNIDVCPYCNRQYVFTIKDGDGRPQIDHFYPQSDFPYLSCSLYNFIPSCPQCNHQKSNILNKYASSKEKENHKEFKYDSENRAFTLYPYEESFETKDSNGKIDKTAWFRALYDKQKDDNSPINDSICVKVKKKNSPLNDKIDNSIEAFHLNELYSCNKIEMNNLFDRYCNYCKPKIDEITKLVLQAQLGDDSNDKTISTIAKTYSRRMKNMILGIPLGAKDKQYPLRKFKEDIIDQLDETYKKMKQ